MEQPKTIRVLDYTEYPGPRYHKQGENSGEDFYHEILNSAFAEAFKAKLKLVVNLDGTAGYATSFLDEAFGNLVYDFSLNEVSKRILIISNEEPDWIRTITEDIFIDWEKRRNEKLAPKTTKNHEPWFRIIKNELVTQKWS